MSREENRGLCTVIRESLEPWDFLKVSPVLAACLGMGLLDARQMARRCPGIIADRIPSSQADRLAETLQAVGVSVIIAPSDDLVPLPPEFEARSLDMYPDRLVFHPEDDRKSLEVRPDEIVVMAVGQVFREITVVTQTDVRSIGYGYRGVLERAESRYDEAFVSTESKKQIWPYALFMIRLDSPIQIQIYSDKFNYFCLGDKRQTRSEASFAVLFQELAGRFPKASLNPGAQSVLQGAPLDKGFRFKNERDFETHLHWFLQVALCNRNTS